MHSVHIHTCVELVATGSLCLTRSSACGESTQQ